MPKVSVITPIYGVEKYIERCARSLFEQTLDDMEFIFVDDCTTDNSISILENVIKDYPIRANQTRILHHEKNMGLPVARQTGIKEASGDFIAHCDSDDWVDINMYKDMYDTARSLDSDCVICDAYKHDGVNNCYVIKGCFSTEKNKLQKDLLFQNVGWAVWNKLFKRDLYDRLVFFPKENMGEDMVLTMQLITFCNKIAYLDKCYYYYYFNPESIVRKKDPASVMLRFEQNYENYLLLEQFYKNIHKYNEYKRAFNWIKYSVKSLLDYPSAECMDKWRATFPFLEFLILLYPEVSTFRKRMCLSSIIKNYLRLNNA